MSDWAERVWINGSLCEAGEARVSVFDRSFLLGDGLFETVGVFGGRLFRLDRHLARLQSGAECLRLDLPFLAQIPAAIAETLRANHLTRAAVRITVSRGAGPPGPGTAGAGPPLCVIAARPFSGYPERWYALGAVAVISAMVKNEHSPICRFKTTSYVEHVLARAEAAQRGADEALLLNTRGHVVEGSSTNLFAISDGCVCTPGLDDGCLPGVTREAVLVLARQDGIEVKEEPLPPAALARAEEAFLTNSLLGVGPLVKVDGGEIGGGHPGSVTRRLGALLWDLMEQEATTV
jgi:branched-chain amino acid aminotransferase